MTNCHTCSQPLTDRRSTLDAPDGSRVEVCDICWVQAKRKEILDEFRNEDELGDSADDTNPHRIDETLY